MRLSIVLKYLSITAFFIAIISLIGFKLFFQKGAGLDNANRGVVAQLQLPAENELGKELTSNNISTPTQKLLIFLSRAYKKHMNFLTTLPPTKNVFFGGRKY